MSVFSARSSVWGAPAHPRGRQGGREAPYLGSAEEEGELVPESREGPRLGQAQQQAQRVEHAHAVQACAPAREAKVECRV